MTHLLRHPTFQAIAGLTLLAIVIATSDPSAILARLGDTNVPLAAAAIAGLTAVHAVAAVGWWAGLRLMANLSLPWRRLLAIHYAGQAIGGVTPANLGGDAYRIAALRGAGWSVSVAPLVVQRATSYLALSVLGAAGLGVLASQAQIAAWVVVVGGCSATAVAGAVALMLHPPRPLRGLLQRVGGHGGDPAIAAVPMRSLARAGLVGLAAGLLFHGLSVAFTWWLVVAVSGSNDLGIAVLPMLGVLALARLSLAVPLTISGIGVQEGVVVGLLAVMGLDGSQVLAALLLARIALVFTTIIGVGILLRQSGRPSPVAPLVQPTARHQ